MRSIYCGMHQIEEYWLVCALRAQGHTKAEIARWTRINRTTVREWLDHPPAAFAGAVTTASCPMCPAVDRARELSAAYAYLLGLYLGDGCISETAKPSVFKLRVVLDERYPALNAGCVAAMEAVMPRRVTAIQREGCIEFVSHSKHWPCLFPQHGAGPKHSRKIELVDWQCEIADSHPKELLRGLIHSDGCRVMNRVWGGKYEYPRYFFSNRSADVHAIFRHACDLLGVRWRQNNGWNTNVARRDDVAFLDTFIGPKR